MSTPEEAEEFIEFISAGGVDESAANSFYELDELLQQEIMMRGSLAEGRNPSACLIGRIRDAKRKGGIGKKLKQEVTEASRGIKRKVDDENEEVEEAEAVVFNDAEEFLASEQVDEKAAQALREIDPELQQLVMNRGTVSVGRNPSAMLIGRVRDAKKTAKESASKDQVETFIQEEGVDVKAADALRELPPALQIEVLSVGTLEGGRNPSAMLLGRIRNAKAGQGAMPMAGSRMQPHGRNFPAMQVAHNRMPVMQQFVPMPVQPVRSKGKLARMTSARVNSSEAPTDIEEFIASEGVDEKAATALRELDPSVQQMVMSRGALAGGKNPSAMLIGRIRDARSSGRVESKVEAFIQEQGIDEKAADSLRELEPYMQEEVINRGPVDDGRSRNVSAVLIGRIRNVKREASQMMMMPDPYYGMMQMAPRPMMQMAPGSRMASTKTMMPARGRSNRSDDVEIFIQSSGVDESAGQQLRDAAQNVQQQVMGEGELVGRNPSAMLIGRLRKCRGS